MLQFDAVEPTSGSFSRGRLLLVILLGAALAALGFFAGYGVRARMQVRFPVLEEAYDLLQTHYVDALPEETLLERGMVRGMLDTVGDPYTTLVEPAAAQLLTDELAGEYGGIGASVSFDDAGRVILVPFPSGPAATAGVVEGDVLLEVDGRPVSAEMGLEPLTAALRGPIGSKVRLRLAPAASPGTVVDLELVRERIQLPSVTSFLLPSHAQVGVIILRLFSDKTPSEVEAAFDDLTGRAARGLVLDLRGNSGGLLDSAVEIARFFLPPGVVLREHRAGGQVDVIEAQARGRGAGLPIAVLIDGGTASAAEILAAALQAGDGAVLIGSPSFGKGSVQAIFELNDGASLHVTIARWLTPGGEQLDHAGLSPDLAVPEGDNLTDDSLAAAATWVLHQLENGP